MNLKEAAQQALEALEVWKDSLFDENALPGWRFSVLGEKAITDLRAALAEDAMQRLADEQQMIERGTKAWADVPDATAWVNEMRGNVPAPTSQESRQVEPVAWMCSDETMCRSGYERFSRVCEGPWNIPVYTAPPQRKPLTEEAIAALLSQSAGIDIKLNGGDLLFARAIERAHGIGGEE